MSMSYRLSEDARRHLLYGQRSLHDSPMSIPAWQFPGWGSHLCLAVPDGQEQPEAETEPESESEPKLLGEAVSTAICGNDITSSCLYTAGLTAAAAGVMAPVALLLVSLMLYLFRSVYGEVGSALPMNGGAYNCLLNTTSKFTASMAAALTLLSYVATGTVSAISACQYLNVVLPDLNVKLCTQLLLLFFALLTIYGIGESGSVALVLFSVHILTLLVLVLTCIARVFSTGTDVFSANWSTSLGSPFDIFNSLVVGFAVASLGISGYESSANFIEEQQPGVFPKTLRNMWLVSTFFNPLLSLISLFLVPLSQIQDHEKTLLSEMGRLSGDWFGLQNWVAVDAFLVLSGAVLTSFIGVTGLCKRMAYDRCLPHIMLNENVWRHTNHYIIIAFLIVCSSMQYFMDGDVRVLSGVYSISFLSVMGLFAIGDALLKYKRDALPRPLRAKWKTIFAALLMVTVSLVTTILTDLRMFRFFLLYFVSTAAVISFMFFRFQFLMMLIYFSRLVLGDFPRLHSRLHDRLTRALQTITSQSVVFFTPSDHISVMNKAVMYIRRNEHTSWVRIVYIYDEAEQIPADFCRNVRLLDSMYPKTRIDSVLLKGALNERAVDTLSKELHIPKNMMFICCPEVGDLQWMRSNLTGVRIITRHIGETRIEVNESEDEEE